MVAIPLAAAIAVATGAHVGSATAPSAVAAGPGGAPVPPVGDIGCDPALHGAAPMTIHLSIVVNGENQPIPATVGAVQAVTRSTPSGDPQVVSARCYYWLHTGRADGLLHVATASAQHRAFDLGDFFDVWHQPLGTVRVGAASGPVTSYVNGKRFTGNPRSIPLTRHAVIQLDIGEDQNPAPYTFGPDA